MDNVYMLTDAAILTKIGEKVKTSRLKQNITQKSLSEAANVSLCTVINLEKGKIGSFDSLLRVLRTLGRLDLIQPAVEEEPLSPNEYFDLVNSSRKLPRRRAQGKISPTKKVESEW